VTLIGRESELELVRTFLGSSADDGGALLLSGEPGVGKTAILDAAAEFAVGAGTRSLRATGVEFEATVSFSGLGQLLLPLRSELGQLSATHRAALSVALDLGEGPPPDRLVLSTAALSLVRAAASSNPVVMIVDDVQWLDPATTLVLGSMARRLAGSHIGFLAAMRTDSGSVIGTIGLPEHQLRALGESDSSGLIGTHFPMLPARVHQRMLAEAQGNPLALLELPAALSTAERSGLRTLPDILPLGQRLDSLFGARVAALPKASRSLLLLAALEGRGDLAIVQATAPANEALTGLAPAERARLVSVDQGRQQLNFRHPLIRSTVVKLASDHDRRRAHRALGEVLADQPERRAWHLAEASEHTDEVVAGLLEKQARRILRRGDAVGAVTALTRAADLSPHRDDRTRRQIAAAYIGADVTGDLRNAAALLETARAAEPALVGSLPVAVAASYLLVNAECELDTAHRLLVQAIETHPGRDDPKDEVMVEALHSLLIMCWFGGRPELWAAFERAVSRLGSDVDILVDVCQRSFGDPVRGAASARELLSGELEELHDEHDPIRITRLGLACVYTDRMGECRDALWRVIRDGRAGGAVALAIHALVSSCIDDWLTGQWDEAKLLVAEGMALSEAYGYRRYSIILGGYIQELISVARGDTDRSTASADEMADWAAARGAGMASTFAHHLHALRAISEGDFEEAYQQACAISPAGILAPYSPHALWVLFDLVESAMRTGRRAEAAAHVEAMRQANIGAISPRLALLTAGTGALTADDDSAPGLFKAALAVPGAERWPFDLARVQLAYGEWLRRSRSHNDARAPLQNALELFERLGARPWATRARGELRAAGQTTSTATGQGQASLSAQEREIAQLAASGLTNKQIGDRLFMSHRTVGARLYQVFPKLGITSRAALRDALGDDNPARPDIEHR
jgi:DNA-binding CsgD family transcriptional regulator